MGLVVGKVTPLVEMRGPETRLVVTNRRTLQNEVEEDPTLARWEPWWRWSDSTRW